MEEIEWILCPVCKSKTRLKIRKDTVLKNLGQSLFLWDLTHDPTKIYTGRHPCLNPEGMLGSI